jgi:futalosine hydrolase
VLDGLGQQSLQILDPWVPTRVDDRFDLVHSGVGKANAAGATARAIDPDVHVGVLSVGIAGALPGSGLELLDVVCAQRSAFSDEGIGAESGFIPMSEAGFGAFPDGTMGIDHDEQTLSVLESMSNQRGTIATVSWCSGSDGCAAGVVNRTGAICEAMEGAAVALAARRVSPDLRTGELRVISNTTGDRSKQRWALDESLDRLGAVLGPLAGTLG